MAKQKKARTRLFIARHTFSDDETPYPPMGSAATGPAVD